MSEKVAANSPLLAHESKSGECLVWIGAGGVASNLAPALQAVGYPTVQVVARSQTNAQQLADTLGADVWADSMEAFTDPNGRGLHPDATLVLLAVPDDAVASVAACLSRFAAPGLLVVHTAGSVARQVLDNHGYATGVFYPLQTMSRQRQLTAEQLRVIPLLIEAEQPEDLVRLQKMANSLTNTVLEADSELRFGLHIGAVVASNYVNELLRTAGEIAARVPGADARLYLPLVREVLDKLDALGPDAAQTGPARRGDVRTLQRHAETLDAWGDADAAQLYRALAKRILRRYHPDLHPFEG